MVQLVTRTFRSPRCYRLAKKNVAETFIHTMVDASLLAYAAVSYVRNKYEVERRWPARVRDLERGAEDPKPLFRGEDGHANNLNLFVSARGYPRVGDWN